MGDLEDWIYLVCRFSSRKASNSACSNGDKGERIPVLDGHDVQRMIVLD